MFANLALSNLDFEVELSYEYDPSVPVPLYEKPEWHSILRLLPEAREAQGLSFEMAGCFEGVEKLTVWGVTPRTAKLAKHLGLAYTLPPVSLVREINDKRFSHRLEGSVGERLPGARVVDSFDTLHEAIVNCPFPWVLKHPLGLGARSRLLGRSGTLSPSARAWAQRKFERGWSLIFEPWVQDKKQFSLHFQLDKGHRVTYLGHCEVLTSAQGVYRGSLFDPASVVDEDTFRGAQAVASQIAQKGYWGPLTIDSFRGSLGEKEIFRPLLDINARYSYGRLGMGIADWLPQDFSYLWWHLYQIPGRPGELPRRTPFTPLPEQGEQGILTDGLHALPLCVDPERATRTVVVVAPTRRKLRSRMLRLFDVEI